VIDQKELGYVEYFSYFGCMMTNVARSTCEIKSMIAMAKSTFNKKKHLFISKLDLFKFMKETTEVLHFSHSQKWC